MVSRLAWSLLLAGLLLASYGPSLNDEADQASALWNLGHGSLLVEEYPEAFYKLNERDRFGVRSAGSDLPVGSTMLNVLSLPVAGALFVVDAVVPLWLAFSVLATVAMWGALGMRWPWSRQWQWSRHEDRVEFAFRWMAFLVALALAANGFRATSPDLSLWFPHVALQVTNLSLWAVGAVLMWKLLGKHLPDPKGRTVALLAAVLGPWLYWGEGLKYHALSTFLVVALLVLRSAPRTPRRDLASGLVAGLAIWNSMGAGVVVLFALVLTELPRAWAQRRNVRGLAKSWAVLALGLAIGLSPWMAQNTYLTGTPFLPPESASSELATPLGQSELAENATTETSDSILLSLRALPGILAGAIGWDGPVPFTKNLLSILTTGHRVEAAPMGVLLVSPLLLAAIPGAFIALRRGGRTPEATLAIALLVSQALILTHAASGQGAGNDVRMWVPMIPALGLLAAIGAKPWLRPLDAKANRRAWMIAAASVILGFLALATLVHAGHRFANTTHQHGATFLWAWLGLSACTAGIVVAAAIAGSKRAGRNARPVVLGIALATTIIWSIMWCLVTPSQIPDYEGHVGGRMLVPVMDDVVSLLDRAVTYNPPLPTVYDIEGRLVIHPDYGFCTDVPNPCPEEIRWATWATNSAPASG